MKIKIIKCLQDNYSYLIVDEDEGIACVIDPSEAKPVINYIEKNILVFNFYIIYFNIFFFEIVSDSGC